MTSLCSKDLSEKIDSKKPFLGDRGLLFAVEDDDVVQDELDLAGEGELLDDEFVQRVVDRKVKPVFVQRPAVIDWYIEITSPTASDSNFRATTLPFTSLSNKSSTSSLGLFISIIASQVRDKSRGRRRRIRQSLRI